MEQHLTPAVFYILLALASGRRHGYQIMKDAGQLSEGACKIGPATLYTTIQRLLDLGWAEEVDAPADADSRRRYYQLTREGRGALHAEVNRLESAVLKARALGAKPARGRA